MENQVKEAARQILGIVSDIQASTSMLGLVEVTSKLADIREKAAWIYEGDKGARKVVEGYQNDADQSLAMLTHKAGLFLAEKKAGLATDADRLQIQCLVELVAQRNRVYFERRNRYTQVIGKGNKCLEESDGE